MIFLSHTHADKPVVEPVALRLRGIFGQDQVFYDSWSVQPGDGIIDKMNQGLQSPQFVFFFVSQKSLTSGMVKLEWQNALYKTTRGQTKIIPVRVDGCEMPPVLLQSLYIDMFSNGLEAAIAQIVNVVQGNTTFTPQHFGFSNLTYAVQGDPSGELLVTISASHLLEPNPDFIALLGNAETEVQVELNGGQPYRGGWNANLKLDNGHVCNGLVFAPLGGTITPQIPMVLKLKATTANAVNFQGLLHRKTQTTYEPVPRTG